MNHELIAIQKQCRRRLKELAHTIDGDARTAAAIDSRDWCNLHVPELALHYKSKSDEYWRQFKLWFGAKPEDATEREIDDQIREARLYRIGRYAFLLVETIAGAVLAAIYFNAPRWLAIIIGVILAALLGGAAGAVVTRWVRHGAADQPPKQLERITRGLLVLGLPWLLACVSGLAVLRGQGTDIGGFLFFISTTAVTLLSPLCSGLCGYAAELMFWSKRLCADLRWIRSLARELDHLLTTSERSIPPPPSSGATPVPISGVFRLIAPAATTAVMLAMALFGAPTPCRAADIPVYVYPDLSPSARAGEVIQVLKTFTARLSNYQGDETVALSVIPFFEEAYSAAPMVLVRIPGSLPVSCPAADKDSEIARLSKSYAENARRDAARKCDELRAQARRDAAIQRAAEIGRLADAVNRLPGLKLPGRCTAVNAIISRAARETPNGISIVITDLENTCSRRGVVIRPELANQVFIVPVGSQQHSIEEGLEGIQSRVGRTMPWARVVESFRLEIIMDFITHPEPRIAPR